MAYYKSLREFIEALERNGKLVRVRRPMIKETELMPLVRVQFRGLAEEDRKGFLFENVTSVTGRKYEGSVAVGCLSASREMYALGLMCEANKIAEKWAAGLLNPIKPLLVKSAPCQEEEHLGSELASEGLDELPVPVNTPGFSGVLRTTDSHVITKDIETGVQNCGCYQGHFLDRNVIGLGIAATHHGAIHWRKCKERGVPMPVAIVIGVPPNVAYVSVTTLPYATDEMAAAGGLAGEPVELVRCRTVDLVVPAQAEIVIEGEVSTKERVGCFAFGEYTGYMCTGGARQNYLMRVTAITHRRRPIYSVIHSQMPPSESSKMVQVGMEGAYFKHLRYDCNIPGVLEVAFPESGGGRMWCVIRMKKRNPSEVWQALSAANAIAPGNAKVIIVVDEDIDPKDSDSVNWALSFRMQPHRDIHVMRGRTGALDYSAYPPGSSDEEVRYPEGRGSSSLLIDATLKWPYPPTSLPKKEYMDGALKIWNELGLGPVKLKAPWYGYNLGFWTEEDEENAELIVSGKYREVGKKLLTRSGL